MENPLLKKMKYRDGQSVHIINAPEECITAFPADHSGGWPVKDGQFLLVFTKDSRSLKNILEQHEEALRQAGLAWIAYPKKSSGISSDLSREVVWGIVGTTGLSPVAQVSINDNWSALRFRPEQDVKHSEKAGMDIPEDMMFVLQSNAKVLQAFISLSATNRREYIAWIKGAKKKETRERRLAELKQLLLNGAKNPSEK